MKKIKISLYFFGLIVETAKDKKNKQLNDEIYQYLFQRVILVKDIKIEK